MSVFPTNDAYYGLMEKLVDRLTHAATLLTETIEDPGSQAEDARREHSSRSTDRTTEDLVAEVHARLKSSSVAPFDRGDVHGIAMQLEEAVALVESASVSAAVYGAGEVDPVARRLAAIALRATEVLSGAVAELRSPKSVMRWISEELKPLRDDADRVYEVAVESLFSGTPNTMDALKRKTLYDLLQATVQVCMETGGMLERIAIKGG
jgi:uncharacterized protein